MEGVGGEGEVGFVTVSRLVVVEEMVLGLLSAEEEEEEVGLVF